MELRQRELKIACPAISTLLWDGDELVDVTSGVRIGSDGSIAPKLVSSGYPFDRAVGVRHENTLWAIQYANRGTKGVLLKNGTVHRELNRSFYFAHAYDYPVAMAVGPANRVIVIHCPNDFDTIEIEDADSGASLAKLKTPDMEFHSRLAVSGDAKYLLDAGWFWHPLGGASVYDLARLLSTSGASPTECKFSFGAEIDSAAFLGDDLIVVTSTEEVVNEDIPVTGIGPRKVGVWSLTDRAWCSVADLGMASGTIMPWQNWVIAFHECPKAINRATGHVAYSWDHIYSGKQVGSIELGDPPPPPMAFDSVNGRFAIADENGVTIVWLESSSILKAS